MRSVSFLLYMVWELFEIYACVSGLKKGAKIRILMFLVFLFYSGLRGKNRALCTCIYFFKIVLCMKNIIHAHMIQLLGFYSICEKFMTPTPLRRTYFPPCM